MTHLPVVMCTHAYGAVHPVVTHTSCVTFGNVVPDPSSDFYNNVPVLLATLLADFLPALLLLPILVLAAITFVLFFSPDLASKDS